MPCHPYIGFPMSGVLNGVCILNCPYIGIPMYGPTTGGPPTLILDFAPYTGIPMQGPFGTPDIGNPV